MCNGKQHHFAFTSTAYYPYATTPDKSVFGPLNAAYNVSCSEFTAETPLNIVNKWTFPSLFSKAWDRAVTADNIRSGFSSCGIYPFSPNAVSTRFYLPSLPTDVPLPPTTVPLPPSDVLLPPTTVQLPPTAVPLPPTVESLPPTDVPLPPTTVPLPPSDVLLPPTAAPLPPTAVPLLPTDLPLPPTDTTLPPNDFNSQDATDGPSGEVHMTADAPPEIEDPLLLLDLITNSKLEICTEQVSEVRDTSLWNTEIANLFLPSSQGQENDTVRKQKRVTSHRLLTSEDIIREKREAERKRMERELLKEKRKIKREEKAGNAKKSKNK